jgi:hypothetical protein
MVTKILLTYRQFIFVTVYSHLLCESSSDLKALFPDEYPVLDHSSQIWWRWMNIFFTLVIWSIELLVTSEDDKWKVD